MKKYQITKEYIERREIGHISKNYSASRVFDQFLPFRDLWCGTYRIDWREYL